MLFTVNIARCIQQCTFVHSHTTEPCYMYSVWSYMHVSYNACYTYMYVYVICHIHVSSHMYVCLQRQVSLLQECTAIIPMDTGFHHSTCHTKVRLTVPSVRVHVHVLISDTCWLCLATNLKVFIYRQVTVTSYTWDMGDLRVC